MRYLVTGGAGFIGSAFIRFLLQHTPHSILNIDKLTYAVNPEALSSVHSAQRYQFVQADINDVKIVSNAFESFQPDVVIHLAAESHVDRSIASPEAFIHSNINGTYVLLHAAQQYCERQGKTDSFRFLYVGTDEVYGSNATNVAFTESASMRPSSPYSASKASGALLANSWATTYGFPCIISHCSNNYGPFQHAEKLIPKVIHNALNNEPIPIYGNGLQMRDWLYVDDHVRALYTISQHGRLGNTYNIATGQLTSNIQMVEMLLDALATELTLDKRSRKHLNELITSVADRPGHDQCYSINSQKITSELGWSPTVTLANGIKATVNHFLDMQ